MTFVLVGLARSRRQLFYANVATGKYGWKAQPHTASRHQGVHHRGDLALPHRHTHKTDSAVTMSGSS